MRTSLIRWLQQTSPGVRRHCIRTVNVTNHYRTNLQNSLLIRQPQLPQVALSMLHHHVYKPSVEEILYLLSAFTAVRNEWWKHVLLTGPRVFTGDPERIKSDATATLLWWSANSRGVYPACVNTQSQYLPVNFAVNKPTLSTILNDAPASIKTLQWSTIPRLHRVCNGVWPHCKIT